MWIYRHWRLVAGGIFTLLAGIAIIAVLVAFPPALPFFAGFVALSASALIPIVTALTMAAAAFIATLFNVVCKLLSPNPVKTPWGENLDYYWHRTEKYGPLKALAYSLLIGAAAFVITAIVVLIGGASFVAAPVWIAAGTALAIGFGIGVLLHAAFFGSLRLDNYCGKKNAEKYEFPNQDGVDLGPGFDPVPDATNGPKAKKSRNPFADLLRKKAPKEQDQEEEENLASKETKTLSETPRTTTTLRPVPSLPRGTQPLNQESKTTAPLNNNKPKPPSEPNPHRAKSQAEGSDAQSAPKPTPPPPRRKKKEVSQDAAEVSQDAAKESKHGHHHKKKHKVTAPGSSDASPSPKNQTEKADPKPAPVEVEADRNEVSEQAKLLIAQRQKMEDRKARKEAAAASADNSSSPATTLS